MVGSPKVSLRHPSCKVQVALECGTLDLPWQFRELTLRQRTDASDKLTQLFRRTNLNNAFNSSMGIQNFDELLPLTLMIAYDI